MGRSVGRMIRRMEGTPRYHREPENVYQRG